jgi:hypothetical protein
MRKGSLGLSNSEMQDFRRCRRKWYWSYYRGLARTREEPGSALHVGNLVHDALAHYYDPESSWGDPVAYGEGQLAEEIAEFPAEEDALRKEFELVRAMLEGYMEWLAETGIDADLRVLGSERMIRVPMRDTGGHPTGVFLLSKIDVPVERISDGARTLLEHKTVGYINSDIKMGYRINGQFLTEHLARFLESIETGQTAEEAIRDCSGVSVNMLRKTKRTARSTPPFYEREEVHHNILELRSHWKHVMAIALEIADTEARLDAGESHHTACPPTPIPDRCSWECPYFRVCPLADDGSDIEGALGAMFEVRDPLKRYEGAEEL